MGAAVLFPHGDVPVCRSSNSTPGTNIAGLCTIFRSRWSLYRGTLTVETNGGGASPHPVRNPYKSSMGDVLFIAGGGLLQHAVFFLMSF